MDYKKTKFEDVLKNFDVVLDTVAQDFCGIVLDCSEKSSSQRTIWFINLLSPLRLMDRDQVFKEYEERTLSSGVLKPGSNLQVAESTCL